MKNILTIIFLALSTVVFGQTVKVAASTSTTAKEVYTKVGQDAIDKAQNDKIAALQAAITTLQSRSTGVEGSIKTLQESEFVLQSKYWNVNKTKDTITFNSAALIADVLIGVNVPQTNLQPLYDSITTVSKIASGKLDANSTIISDLKASNNNSTSKFTALKQFFEGILTIAQLSAILKL